MKHFDKITPEGTRDFLFDECAMRGEVTKRLTKMFYLRGYRQVMTPAIEFYDVFDSSTSHFPQENMYKMTDTHGRLMVMRPDCTIPIARLIATRLAGAKMPLRLYYSQNVYRVQHDMRGKSSEIFQTGVELIGTSSLRSDLEIVELAAESLTETGGEQYRIELCHIGYFKALIDSLDTDDETKEQIRQYIEQKNYASLNDLLSRFGENRAAAALKYLPRLFGGEEVFDKAYALFSENGAGGCLDYLKTIYEGLCQMGLGQRVLIDLGLVNQAEYYTGVIFRGYFDGIGEPVLSGGRYDNLHGDFGAPQPAVGFAFHVDLATQVLSKVPVPASDVLVFADDSHLANAMRYVRSLTAGGTTAETCVFDDFDTAKAYALAHGIGQIHVVRADVKIIDLAKEGGVQQ